MSDSSSSGFTRLLELHQQYCCNRDINFRDHWVSAVRKYSQIKRQSLIDITVDAANISHLISTNPEMLSDPLVVAAIQDTVPTFDFNDPMTGEALEGALNTAKGKYFEYLVVDKLNSGEHVGDIVLPEGYTAKLADSFNQPGWDIQILDNNLHIAEYLQLKATDSMAYIKEALDRYPDTTILTTDEIETPGTEGDLILGSDISNMELEQTILDTMGAYSPSIEEAFFTAFNPLFSLAFIIGTEGLKLSVSAKDKERAILSFKHRATRTVTSQSVGALVYALGGGWLALPATIMTGVVYEHLAELYETSLVIDNSRHLLILLQLEQQGRNMPGYR